MELKKDPKDLFASCNTLVNWICGIYLWEFDSSNPIQRLFYVKWAWRIQDKYLRLSPQTAHLFLIGFFISIML